MHFQVSSEFCSDAGEAVSFEVKTDLYIYAPLQLKCQVLQTQSCRHVSDNDKIYKYIYIYYIYIHMSLHLPGSNYLWNQSHY